MMYLKYVKYVFLVTTNLNPYLKKIYIYLQKREDVQKCYLITDLGLITTALCIG